MYLSKRADFLVIVKKNGESKSPVVLYRRLAMLMWLMVSFPMPLYQSLVKSTVVSSERNISNKVIKVTMKPC